ncbi:hypothetical protein ACOMHN_060892 [Nucella lapillus]
MNVLQFRVPNLTVDTKLKHVHCGKGDTKLKHVHCGKGDTKLKHVHCDPDDNNLNKEKLFEEAPQHVTFTAKSDEIFRIFTAFIQECVLTRDDVTLTRGFDWLGLCVTCFTCFAGLSAPDFPLPCSF